MATSFSSLHALYADFLRGTIETWDIIALDKETFISKLLCPSIPNITHKDLIDLLKTLGPRQVCQYQFKTNDIVWICRECQKDETCVLCNQCYIESEHEGHEVYFYHSAAGGCCDCGDPDAWDPSGFCSKHGKKHDDPISFIPQEMRIIAVQLCNAIVDGFLQSCVSFCDLEGMTNDILDFEDYTITLYYDEFHSIEDFKKLLLSDNLEALLGGHPEEMNELQLVRSGSLRLKQRIPGNQARSILTHLIGKGYTARAFSNFDYRRYDAVLSSLRWLHSIALACDGMCKLICSCLTSARLSAMIDYDMYLDKSMGKAFHDLLLSLMADQAFKMTAAVAYTHSYRRICRDYNRGAGTAGATMFNLSVQFLNRELFVHEICYHYNFIQEACKVLHSILATSPSNQVDYLQTPAMMKRRYSTILGDFKVICAIPDISRLFVSVCLPSWLDILQHIQWLHLQKREVIAHVAFEDVTTWMHAFNLSLGITALFDFLCNWFSTSSSPRNITKDSDSSTKQHHAKIEQIGVQELIAAVMERCYTWQKSNCNTEYLIACCHKVDETVFPRTLVTHEYSFHLPMHRYLSHILFESCKHLHLVSCVEYFFGNLTQDLTSSSVLLHLALRPIVFGRQIKRNMWRRNGMNMIDQVMNYSEIPYSRVFRDLDFLLVQSCTNQMKISVVLRYIFAAYGVLEYTFPEEFVVEDQSLMDFVPDLISDALHLIINLATEIPVEPCRTSSDRLKPLLRRELIQVLTCGPLTYSKLQESITGFCEAEKLSSDVVDEVILQVSNKINPISITAAPMYNLKKELWIEYDPCFPRLTDTMHAKASESRIKCIVNSPIVTPPLLPHPSFAKLRSRLLFDTYLLEAVRNFAYITACSCTAKESYKKLCESWRFKSSDKLLSKIIHLITLAIHEAKLINTSLLFVENMVAPGQVKGEPSPSLLHTIVDIYNSNTASVLGNDYYYLGWIIDEMLCLDPLAKHHYDQIMQSANSKQDIDQRKNMNELKERSQQQALQSIQQAASQFLAMLDDISSSDEEDEDLQQKVDSADQMEAGNEDFSEDQAMDIGSRLSPPEDISSTNNTYEAVAGDEIEGVDGFPYFESDIVDQRTKRTRKNSEAIPECESEHVCIICQSDVTNDKDDVLGYLGLAQPSTVLHRSVEQGFRVTVAKPKVDSTHIMKSNCKDCNLRVGLCGHQMHQSCYLKYFATSQIRSMTQDFMMFDASQGYFNCPLCRKLCNFVMPKISGVNYNTELTEIPTSNEKLCWIDFMQQHQRISHVYVKMEATEALKQLFEPKFHHRIASMMTDIMSNIFESMHTVPSDRKEVLQQLDTFVSCVAYSISSDLAENHVPGYFLPEVQALRASYKTNSNSNYQYHEYSIGHDDLRFTAELICSLQQLSTLIQFDEFFLTSLVCRVAGIQSDHQKPVQDDGERSCFWFDRDTLNPLLTLPLADVVILVLGASFYPYSSIDLYQDEEKGYELQTSCDLIPWLCIAKLVQLMLFHDFSGEDILIDHDESNSLSRFIDKLREEILPNESLPSEYAKYKAVLVEWTIFLRFVIHAISRIPNHPWRANYLHVLGEWAFQDINVETINEDIIANHLEVLTLKSLFTFSEESSFEWKLVSNSVSHWIKDLDKQLNYEATELSPLLPIGSSTSDLSRGNIECNEKSVSAIRSRYKGLAATNMSLTYYPSLPRFKHYPSLKRPSLFSLPTEYSKLHAIISSKCAYEMPVLCLNCGLILDGSGQGQCLVHSYECGAGISIFFAIQDCKVILTHGPRCAYFASPYVDVYGEIRHTVRGKPLRLDQTRLEGLRLLWSRHELPSEILSIRSSATRVIINGYY